mgnify:CR=1 FL=1
MALEYSEVMAAGAMLYKKADLDKATKSMESLNEWIVSAKKQVDKNVIFGSSKSAFLKFMEPTPAAAKEAAVGISAAKSIKQKRIENAVEEILDALGLDLSNDSLRETPTRVAKMYLNEIFGGLNEDISSVLKSFENSYGYKGMVIEKDIPFQSHCEHHLLPILGRAAIAYIPEDRVLGLSKLNRILHHFARRPQVQDCPLYTSPSPRDKRQSRMPSSA